MNIGRGLLRNSSTRLCRTAVLVAVAIAILLGEMRLLRQCAGTEMKFCVWSTGGVGISSETPGPHPAQEFIRDWATMCRRSKLQCKSGLWKSVYPANPSGAKVGVQNALFKVALAGPARSNQVSAGATASGRNFSFKSAAMACP